MTTRLDALPTAVELLERSLAYTRMTLSTVPANPRSWTVPTPCARWDLAALLAHMDDGLDAFSEAALGAVAVDLDRSSAPTISGIQRKACALLGAWSNSHTDVVRVADATMPAPILAATAALEITIHGWDVAQATGHPVEIPAALATDLMPVAAAVISPGERGRRFAAVVRLADGASAGDQLLATTGRSRRRALR